MRILVIDLFGVREIHKFQPLTPLGTKNAKDLVILVIYKLGVILSPAKKSSERIQSLLTANDLDYYFYYRNNGKCSIWNCGSLPCRLFEIHFSLEKHVFENWLHMGYIYPVSVTAAGGWCAFAKT